MKYIRVIIIYLFFSYLLFSSKAYSQSNNNKVNIQWTLPGYVSDHGDSVETLKFQEAIYTESDNYLPSFQAIFYNSSITEYKILNPVFQALSEKEKSLIDTDFKPKEPKISIDIKTQNKKSVSFITILPFKYDSVTSTYQKLISFDYSIKNSSLKSTHVNARIASGNTNSVLASGNWYKLRIAGSDNSTGSGIYKIDYAMLSSMGIDVKGIDPRKIGIYGYGGMLPQLDSAFRYDDLVENSIYVSGEEDSTFDETDYILFYAQGPHTWTFDSLGFDPSFHHNYNIYSDNSFYFLTIKEGNKGNRVQNVANIGGGTQVTTYDEHIFHESDRVNILSSGREWYGELFQFNSSQSFQESATGIIPNTNIKLTSCVLGRSSGSSSFTIRLNGNLVGTQTFTHFIDPLVLYQDMGDQLTSKFFISSGSSPSSTIDLNYSYDNKGINQAIGNLNYFELNFQRQLALYGNQTAFRAIGSKANAFSEFVISGATSDMKIWDITNIASVQNQLYTLNGTAAKFSKGTKYLKEFIAFKGSDFSKPQFVGTVPNQNLHSIVNGNIPDMVIVTTEDFKAAADRLAQFREMHDKLDVEVVTLNKIYNEFSSGAQEITAIRDFMKMLYERSNSSDSIRYLLLFGSCSYDYKNRIGGNTNVVPIYESRESLHNIDSHSSDDYFGFLDPSEGNLVESNNNSDNGLLDIGVGRLTVKTPGEAEDVVSKLINYSSNRACMGKWRNKITFIADDGPGDFVSMNGGSEGLSAIAEKKNPSLNVNKLYIDAYPQEPAPGGETSPIVKNAIDLEMEKGNLILNYSGHGSEALLAQEKIIEINQIAAWTNYNKLPFFVTATCEFGRYDDPGRPSGAELCLISPKGGAIGLLSSTRPVYLNTNYKINSKFYEYAFQKVNGEMPRLGDIMIQTKNHSIEGINNRNFALLSDPSLRLAYPEEEIAVIKINDSTVTNIADTSRALDKITITGEIQENGVKKSSFNGTVYLTFYDKESAFSTLGSHDSPGVIDFKLRNNLIYDGSASVKDGAFQISFVIPKDISYQYGLGKISLYAKDSAGVDDAGGFYSNIIIGGSAKNNEEDNTPPKIYLFMGDESFVSGGLVSPNTKLMAKLSDENGINVSSTGIGHEISAVLDGSKDILILNDFYSAEANNYKTGRVDYPMNNLAEGKHTLTLKAWDVYNNSSQSTIEFVVSNDKNLVVDHIYNYPNPFTTSTTFQIDHNRQGQALQVSIEIFNVSGQRIKVIENTYAESPGHIDDLKWDQDIPNSGLYLYKVSVISLSDGSAKSAFGKLVIIN